MGLLQNISASEYVDDNGERFPHLSQPAYYLNFRNLEHIIRWIKLTCTWVLMLTNLVPISLIVSLEFVKLWQAMFMSLDVLMYDEEQDMPMKAQSSNLNEELG